MDCLENVIGIKRICSPNEPISGLYINDLPGISLKTVDASIDEEYASAVQLIDDKITMAGNIIANHLRAGISKIQVKSSVSAGNIGLYVEYERVSPVVGRLKGIQYKLLGSPYLSFFLNSISFYSYETKEVEVFVYDLITGELLDTVTIDAVAGEVVTALVNKKYYSDTKPMQLFICTDSNIEHNQASLFRGHCYGCTNIFSTSDAFTSYSEITTGSPVIYQNLKGANSTGGISVNYNLSCDVDPYLCSIKNLLAMPLLYKTGVLLMEELVYSKRLNSVINVYKNDHKELIDKFESEYMSSMKAIFDNLPTPRDTCFGCNQSIKFVALAP